MGLNMSTSGFYTFVMNDAGYNITNPRFFVGYTNAAPVSVIHNSIFVNSNGSAAVSISTSATPSPLENVYVRYTTGLDFAGNATSFIVQATGSGTSFSATIPTQTTGSTVNYFVFTSTVALTALNGYSEIEKSVAVLNYDDNGRTNYNYTLITLPLKLTSFTGIVNNNDVLLEWKCANEIEIEKYIILRSEDGITFKNIGNVNATNSSAAYTFIDFTSLPKTAFYKLGIEEKDGTIEYSKIIRVSKVKNIFGLSVYPNPAQTFINIKLQNITKGKYQLSIYDATSKRVFNYEYNLTGSEQFLLIPFSNEFKKGSYFVQLILNNEVKQSSFIVN